MAKKSTSTRRNWAKDDIRALKTMVKGNVIASEIALKLERTVAAVYRRAGILGILGQNRESVRARRAEGHG